MRVRQPLRLGVLATATACIALTLAWLDAALHTPTGWAIGDFLTWTDPCDIEQMIAGWGRAKTLAYAYLLLDTFVFMPAYGWLAWRSQHRLQAATQALIVPGFAWVARLVHVAALIALTGLLLFDLLENLGGLARLTRPQGVALFAAWPTAGKQYAMVAVAVTMGLGLMMWAAGAGFTDAHKREQARLRTAVGDVLVRSRYVLVALAMLAALTLVTNQARDVLHALASTPFADCPPDAARAAATPACGAWRLGSALFSLTITAIALGQFAFACWLWTRSACRIRSAGMVPLRSTDTTGAHADHDDGRVSRLTESFTRDWARLMGAAPAVMLIWLVIGVVRDAAHERFDTTAITVDSVASCAPSIAASPIAALPGQPSVLAILGLTFALLLVFACWFLRRRTLSPWPGGTPACTGARHHHADGYYNATTLVRLVRRDLLAHPVRAAARASRRNRRPGWQLWFWERMPPAWAPVLTLVPALACRWLDGGAWTLWGWGPDELPSLALAMVLFSLSFWLSLFGWLSLFEIEKAVPWLLLLVAGAAAMSAFGWTDNQAIWSTSGARPLFMSMFISTLALAGLLVIAYLSSVWIAFGRRARSWRRGRRITAISGVLFVSVALATLVLRHADRSVLPAVPTEMPAAAAAAAPAIAPAVAPVVASAVAPSEATAVTMSVPATTDGTLVERETLPRSLGRWLKALCRTLPRDATDAVPASNEECPSSAYPSRREPVYFVSAEGGGIRAAAWTAMVLAELQRQDAAFLARTYSISAVSGGAIGASVFRACHDDHSRTPDACLLAWARTDHLSPLLSAWLFEDMLAWAMPVRQVGCERTGCGFLSRALWFEQSMIAAVPGLGQPLARGIQADHFPHLFLNATFVETGERSIASDVRIRSRDFPNAKDQLDANADSSGSHADLPLSLMSAAHNASRFPYTNPIGSLYDDATVRDGRLLGHLADGGYFDNSGAQTTVDIVAALGACLDPVHSRNRRRARQADTATGTAVDPTRERPGRGAPDATMDAPEEAPTDLDDCGLSDHDRRWLHAHLDPQVLFIRLGPRLAAKARQSGSLQSPEGGKVGRDNARSPHEPDRGGHDDTPASHEPRQILARPLREPPCDGSRYAPLPGIDARAQKAMIELTGPPLTILNVSGSRAAGRLAEARQQQALLALTEGATAVRALQLADDQVFYPLGWHLSQRAREGIERQARECRLAPAAPR